MFSRFLDRPLRWGRAKNARLGKLACARQVLIAAEARRQSSLRSRGRYASALRWGCTCVRLGELAGASSIDCLTAGRAGQEEMGRVRGGWLGLVNRAYMSYMSYMSRGRGANVDDASPMHELSRTLLQ